LIEKILFNQPLANSYVRLVRALDGIGQVDGVSDRFFAHVRFIKRIAHRRHRQGELVR